MSKKKIKKLTVQIVIFIAVMLLTFYILFQGQDLEQIAEAAGEMAPLYVLMAIFLGLFFVAAEGGMIWYLLRGMGSGTGLLRCIGYSYVGFFFSGITPSATGGQPMQLYYMKRDGNSLSGSSVVLLTAAIVYKFVLVVWGSLLLVFWNEPLRSRLQGYYALFLIGFSLNVLLVLLLLLVMFLPEAIRKVLRGGAAFLEKWGIRKRDPGTEEKIEGFINGYRGAVSYLCSHRRAVCAIILGTFLQRFSAFALTYVIYRGLGLSETPMWDIILLQASVYIAVDMLPIPGAQGITEAMYSAVFLEIFSKQYLMSSLCISRGISFYLVMAISLLVTLLFWHCDVRRKRMEEA